MPNLSSICLPIFADLSENLLAWEEMELWGLTSMRETKTFLESAKGCVERGGSIASGNSSDALLDKGVMPWRDTKETHLFKGS